MIEAVIDTYRAERSDAGERFIDTVRARRHRAVQGRRQRACGGRRRCTHEFIDRHDPGAKRCQLSPAARRTATSACVDARRAGRLRRCCQRRRRRDRSSPTCRATAASPSCFPKWADGRAYSQARLLRARYRFAGEIRATGEVLVDMLPLLARTGFDAVALRADQSQEFAERALSLLRRRPLPGRRDRAAAALPAPRGRLRHDARRRARPRRLRRRRPRPGRPHHGARRAAPARRRRRPVRFARRPGAARARAEGALDRRRQARLLAACRTRRAAARENTGQDTINALLVKHAPSGERVVRLKGGDPSVFGRLEEELEALAAAGIECEVVPGVTAALAAAAATQRPLTRRGSGRSVALTTAMTNDRRPRGRPPRRHRGRSTWPASSSPRSSRRLVAAGWPADDAGARRLARRLARPARQRPQRRHARRRATVLHSGRPTIVTVGVGAAPVHSRARPRSRRDRAEPPSRRGKPATRKIRGSRRLCLLPCTLAGMPPEPPMTHVVLESCIRCKYTDCVDVCPVDCFREGPNFLTIDPDECIDCAVCIPECPVNAIVPEEDVPGNQQHMISSTPSWPRAGRASPSASPRCPTRTSGKTRPASSTSWSAELAVRLRPWPDRLQPPLEPDRDRRADRRRRPGRRCSRCSSSACSRCARRSSIPCPSPAASASSSTPTSRSTTSPPCPSPPARELPRGCCSRSRRSARGFHLGQQVSDARPPRATAASTSRPTPGTRFVAKAVVIAAGVGSFQPRRLKVDGLDASRERQLFYRDPRPWTRSPASASSSSAAAKRR